MDNRPTSRESNVSSDHGYSVDRRGDGLNLGGPAAKAPCPLCQQELNGLKIVKETGF